MSAVVLWSLSLTASPVLLAESVPSTASIRAADDDRPQRRSREDDRGAPPIQMGAGPTALAMLALIAAVIGRAVRRRRAESTLAS